jgi:3-methyladenine DNA glycosylase AlkD
MRKTATADDARLAETLRWLHDKKAADTVFLSYYPIIAQGAKDDRNFVKKSVSWAMKAIASRSAKLKLACAKWAAELAVSELAACQWVGKDVQRQIGRVTRPAKGRSKSLARR